MMGGIHEKFIETVTTSILRSKFKENNENDMAAHEICFDFLNRPKPSQIEQNGFAPNPIRGTGADYATLDLKVFHWVWEEWGNVF